VVDDSQRILSWSDAAAQMFGRSADEVVGRPCWEVLGSPQDHVDCRPGCRMILEFRRGRVLAHPDIHARHADGRPLTLRASALQVPERALLGAPTDAGTTSDAAQDAGGSERPERQVLVHLVRPRSSPPRRRSQAATGHRGAPGHDDVPPMVNPLSRRELEVLQLLAAGRSTRQIAESLTLSPYTARNHILSIEQKLGAHSRVEALYLARQHGLL